MENITQMKVLLIMLNLAFGSSNFVKNRFSNIFNGLSQCFFARFDDNNMLFIQRLCADGLLCKLLLNLNILSINWSLKHANFFCCDLLLLHDHNQLLDFL